MVFPAEGNCLKSCLPVENIRAPEGVLAFMSITIISFCHIRVVVEHTFKNFRIARRIILLTTGKSQSQEYSHSGQNVNWSVGSHRLSGLTVIHTLRANFRIESDRFIRQSFLKRMSVNKQSVKMKGSQARLSFPCLSEPLFPSPGVPERGIPFRPVLRTAPQRRCGPRH